MGQRERLKSVSGCAFVILLAMAFQVQADPVKGTVTVPYVTGRPERHAFEHRPGWIDVYAPGNTRGAFARIRDDGTFTIDPGQKPLTLIAGFDRMETPPVIIPRWPLSPGDYNVPIHVEYACVPGSYPESWDEKHMMRAREYWQTFQATCTHLYGCSVFDGPKIIWWGNKINVAVHDDRFGTMIDHSGGIDGREKIGRVSATHSDRELPRMGWRHGDMVVEPGRKYALCISGYRSHGGDHLQLDAFVRPDHGDGYGPGEVYADRTATGGDLCFLMFGNGNGQLVENHVRTEEWEIFIPRREPSRNWGQTFTSHGVSLAGIAFWGNNGSDMEIACEVRLFEDGPGGDPIGPVKTAVGHDSPDRPIIRYPEQPAQLPGHEACYKLPADFFQVAYAPGEVPLEPGRVYYIQLTPSEPMMMYADGDFYDRGFAHYEGLKLEQAQRYHTFHSRRWTLAMSIVTYQNPDGAPNELNVHPPRPAPDVDANLIANGGAESGDFTWWTIGGDPIIDPSTDIPEPASHSGAHRFGVSVGWNKADMYQYQEVPNLDPGRTYVAGMWVAHADGTDESAELLWCDGPFGAQEHLLAKTYAEAAKTWQHLRGQPFTPKQSTVTLIVRYRHTAPTNIASIHVDDIYLKAVDE